MVNHFAQQHRVQASRGQRGRDGNSTGTTGALRAQHGGAGGSARDKAREDKDFWEVILLQLCHAGFLL